MQTAFGAPGMQADLDFIERRLRELSLEAAE